MATKRGFTGGVQLLNAPRRPQHPPASRARILRWIMAFEAYAKDRESFFRLWNEESSEAEAERNWFRAAYHKGSLASTPETFSAWGVQLLLSLLPPQESSHNE